MTKNTVFLIVVTITSVLAGVLSGVWAARPAKIQKRPDYPVRFIPITEEERDGVERMTIKLCEVSNPHSDEEPEDMIKAAHDAAKETVCVPSTWIWKNNGWIPTEETWDRYQRTKGHPAP